jgi:hypothetical protein
MKNQVIGFIILLVFVSAAADAQYYGGGIYMERGYRRPPPPRYERRPKQPPFRPTVNLSFGYGFPNLDKNYLAQFSNAYQGNPTQQTGPVFAALDYQFSRSTSIGIMGSYGKVTMPYYDYSSNNGIPAFTGSLENYSILFNMVSYLPASRAVNPYIRTAIGFSSWTQDYSYPDGSKAAVVSNPTDLAYQVSIGARFNFSPNAGFFIEAGYGKYIGAAGLTFRF